ncbi:MAG: hypothetical protein JWP63_6552, partial [Candidatus Solibacter sp.]|nr:hypothetical protein [Candidatus Solibacter sp.]
FHLTSRLFALSNLTVSACTCYITGPLGARPIQPAAIATAGIKFTTNRA